uniref:Uncharacterized protein n=1 Tax=Eptatretus burgeri TaxID=7764 RepID=A0A8C4R7U6_EPTBU
MLFFCIYFQLKIFLVPSHIFSLELLTPQVHCLTHHGTFMPDSSECMTSQFMLPSLALRVGTSEIVPLGGDLTHGPVLEQRTPPAWRSKSKLFPLGALQNQVQLNSSLEESGQYMLIAHYFQPHSPNIPVNVSIFSGTAWQGSFNASFCPHAFGCRTMMVFGPSSAVRLRSGALSMILHPEKNMWLSYVLVVPEGQFQSDLLSEEHFHSYEEFLSSCSYLDLSKSVETSKGFCAETAFSLVAYMSDGAKRCECDHLGSLSQTCQPHGGQCLCRPHVKGHTCDQCQPGFHSFPECRPCECSRGVCDQHTGACTCPPHTLPHTCQACLPGTFAFHSATGCQPCKCHPQGAIDSLCHPLNGQCSCIKGVGGEQCDRCLPGSYGFPFCHQCDCNHSGTSPAICDTTTGHCLCKENVEGTRCDTCIEGSFLLEASNPKGCTKCFCFGVTNRCESTKKRRTQIVTMKGWSLHNIENRDVKMSTSPEEGVVKATLKNRGAHLNEIYWSAPDEFRGDRLASYGGELKFRVQSVGGQEERASWGLPDVVLKGNQLALAWSAPARTTNRSKPWEGRMFFLEENFHHLHSRGPVSREDLMVVLEDVHLLLLRSHSHTSAHQLLLSNVTLETTSSSGSGPVATRVERCLCPFQYRGDSCQECSSGCYREKRGPFLGSCRQCQCNGHSGTCTDGTGECLHCQHGAAGEHCETCRDEFLQADSPGNSSTSVSCFSCPCPMTMASNNFAIGCVRESGEIRCICKDGYTGVNCEKCGAGYFGNPMVVGSQCHPCKCNGNSAECDPFTGRCLNCRGHSAGFHCDHCATGYYADAIDRKHCKVCPCNSCGTASCHPKTGSCTCLPGVTGQLCNTCKEDHFGFGGCKGCKPCDCAEAALNSSCDLSTGQCVCAPGTHGQRCERCKKGFWNYGVKGCLRCNCPSDCCDPLTGACGCAPGLMGDQCDRCNKPGHIPMLNQNGQLLCDACDGCVKDLLSKLENSSNIVSQTESALQKLSVGSFTQTRLKNLNQEVAKAKIQLGEYTALVKKERKDVDLVDNHIKDLHMDMSSLEDKTNKTTLKMKDLEDAVQQMYTKAGISFDQVTQITQFVNDVVRLTTGGAMPGLPISSSEFQRQLAEAERLITKLRARNFDGLKDMALQEKKLADELLKQVQTEFQRRVQELENEKTAASQLLDKHGLLLADILEAVNSARNATNYAESQNSANEDTLEQNKIHARKVRQLKDETEKALDESEKKLEELHDLLNDLETTRMEFEKLAADVDARERPLSEHVDRLSQGASQEPLVQKAEEHARSLRDVAKQLESLVKNTSKDEFLQKAIILSDSYAKIVEMLRKAEEEANNALHAARSAEMEVRQKELGRKAIDAKAISDRLLRESQDETKRKSLQNKLDTAQQKANDAKQKLIDLQSKYRDVWDSLSRVSRDAIQRAIDAAQRDADYASRVAGEVEDELKYLNEEAEKLKANISSNANVEFERALNETSRIINEADKLIPQLLKKLSQVESIRDEAKATADINKVRDIIEEARRSANQVKVSMKFNGTSGVEVRLPKGLEDLRPYTSLEFYIKDMEPLNRGDDVPNEKQFLLYLGKKNTRSRREPQFSEGDYIGAYLENKQVVFVCNLGKGERSIRIPDDAAKIMDDRFSMIRFERIYEMMTMEYKGGVNEFIKKERGLPTDYLFDLNPANTMFYIGTATPIYDLLPPSLKLPNFKGYLELASVNENLASLYNFIKLYNMDTQKEVPAKRYKDSKAAQDFYFEGTGFALLKLEQSKYFLKFEFQMRSTTYNGILIFLEKNELFLCAYIHEGHVKLEYNFGVGVKKVDVKEIDRKIFDTIKILVLPTNKEIKFETTNVHSDPTMPDDFNIFDNLGDTAYIAGVPKDRIPDSVLKNLPVKNSFQGCIRNLVVNKNVDLKQEQTNGVTFGCKDNFLVSRHATFSGKGSIKFIVGDFDSNHFEFGLTVQTDQPNGALISSNDGGLKLALLNGKVEFLFRNTKIVSPENVNDGYPHYIRVSYLSPDSTGQGHVWLGVDNVEHQVPHKESFGKIDTTFNVGFDNRQRYPYFTGCMSNLYIESQGIDKVKDFNTYVEKSNVALERCPISTTRV